MKRFAIAIALFTFFLLVVSRFTMAEEPKIADEKSGSSEESAKKKRYRELAGIKELLDRHQYQQAVDSWERLRSGDSLPLSNDYLVWGLAQAYRQLHKIDDAIRLYERFYIRLDSLTVRERAQIGEELIFGEIGGKWDNKVPPPGKAQCPLCHTFAKHIPPYHWGGTNLYGIIKKSRELVASPTYVNRPKDTEQPEVFPGSGIASDEMEYLAESKICPSCYIVPGTWMGNVIGKESPEPKLHRPPASLSVDEMIAIDTWLFQQEGEPPPPLKRMRKAYDKFMKKEQRAGLDVQINLASLYDAKGDLDRAVRLLEEVYPYVVDNDSKVPDEFRHLINRKTLVNNDPEMFSNLKQHPDIVAKFPLLLLPD